MYKKKLFILATAVGLLGTSAAVGASGLVSKVAGVLNKEVSVSVDGKDTDLHPVYIDGKAYLPARDVAGALGYSLNWNSKGKEIELKAKDEQAVQYMRMMGVIVDVSKAQDGSYRIELLGKGDDRWMILFADKDTELTDKDGKPVAAGDLKAGMRLTAEFGPIVAMSYPGQSHAHRIVVSGESLVKEDVIQSVEKTKDGWQIIFGETKSGVAVPTLKLTAGKETSVMTAQGESVAFESLKTGDKVRAYYGPFTTKSIPPQSPLHYLVVLSDNGQLAPVEIQEYRELAWKSVPDGEKIHLTTKKDEAQVTVIDSKDIRLLNTPDEQKNKLEEIKAANGKLVEVMYNTDQDTLIGPLKLVFDPESKALVGFFIRK
ncbi:copper amine oxidase N-terminal domain-containing protein [Cohnella mopanensis]|uniref:copper amine oxidase N-terminal domain-containing protein n=1 Tax=Cohnella mopanensis TaxID=2911966 RepID=UPI001EF85DE8|nr:copper amine oxidase N-terminal domain-containing protein [Cohnella mopanensis]